MLKGNLKYLTFIIQTGFIKNIRKTEDVKKAKFGKDRGRVQGQKFFKYCIFINFRTQYLSYILTSFGCQNWNCILKQMLKKKTKTKQWTILNWQHFSFLEIHKTRVCPTTYLILISFLRFYSTMPIRVGGQNP